MLRKLFLIPLVFSSLHVFAQLDSDETSYYFGLGVNHYFRGLTPIQIYTSDINRTYNPTKPFDHLSIAPSVRLGIGSYSEGEGAGIEFERCDTRVSCEYNGYAADSSIVTVNEKIKVINSKLKFRITRFPSFSFFPEMLQGKIGFGASVDLGTIRNRRKRSGGGYSDKWELFYTKTGLSKTRGFDITFGASLILSYRITNNIYFQYQRQFMLMDASFNGYSGNKAIMNSQFNHYGLIFHF
jgi:hypothetical protein